MIEDAELLKSFEDGTFPAENFHHHEHVRVAWLYLRRHDDVLTALARFSSGLRKFAAAHGHADRYHETLTWAYVFLINERMRRGGGEQQWEQFAAQNGDLLNWQPDILAEYYDEQTLQSEVARKVFVLPDKAVKGRRP